MRQSFYKSSHLTPQQLGDLIKKDNKTSSIHFLAMYSLFIAAAITLVLTWENGGWITAFAFVLFATSIPALFACEHESAHQTAFKNRSLNYWAALFAGVSYGYIPTLFRDFHFAHHQYTHQPGLDPEISFAGRPVPSIISNLPSYLSWLTGFPLVIFRLLSLIIGALGMPGPIQRFVFPFVKPEHRLQIFLESWLTLFIHGSIVYLAIAVHTGFWGLIWGQFVGSALLAAYTAPEHNGLPHEGSIMEKTRSIKSNAVLRWWMWNMPYHAEHHAYPAVPHHALPQLHVLLDKELIHQDSSHANFHGQVLQDTTIGALRKSK